MKRSRTAPGEPANRRRGPRLALSSAALLVLLHGAARADPGFVGQTRCANPTCHGAALPAQPVTDPNWRPWKSARTQWLNQNIDRHSRAYKTLTSEESKRIAGYMGIEATTSEKCVVCHAPPAARAADSKHQPSDGVSCEHCHGPAELWLEPHKATDWRQHREQYATKGFTDNRDFRVRAETCARCHVEIDHEIIAGGHPPLQFEMVAYAQVMKHWDDGPDHPGFNPDPALWAVGQIVGLRHAAAAIARRASSENYQSLGEFPHFKDHNCYQCHHKLVEDAVRQAQGHVDMAEIVFGSLFPDAKAQLTSAWAGVESAARSSASAAQQQANSLHAWLEPFEARVLQSPPDKAATKRMLQQLLSNGAALARYETFSYSRAPTSDVLRLQNVELPWWYTTGSGEQTALAIQALCGPAFDEKTCAGIFPELKTLVGSINRTDRNPAAFNGALNAIKAKLFH